MSRFSIEQFVEKTSERDHGQGFFELENERLLEVNISSLVWMKKGAMVAYRGDIKFEREGILEQGLGKLIKKGLTGEGAQLTKATGTGKLYLADEGKKISILELTSDSIFVNGNDLLAFEDGIQWDIKMMRKLSAIAAGGLFNVKLDGSGLIAITTHYDPITLVVTPDSPIVTDPNATVAWSGTLTPELKTDLQLKSFLGRGSGESFQMRFAGTGFVVVQPYEEIAFQHTTG
ncbi:MAG: AIM24 family protein [Phycisphaeraceae bacterium]|nr:AIM24 family protein [Phycisphaerales bacterium]MCB9860618.1 AIM24 family protein [Phycisphaeraceae bacterium]